MAKKQSIELKLPTAQIEFIRDVAKLAGVSENSAMSVLLAVQMLSDMKAIAKATEAANG